MKKKIVLFCLMIALTFLFCTPAFAAESGTCGANGDNLTWTLDDSGVLTITGTGNMANWYSTTGVPWKAKKSAIKQVVLSEGVTSIGDYAFSECTNLAGITVPTGVTAIGKMAFYKCSSLTEFVIPESVIVIEGEAFEGCTALSNITIPAGVTNIEAHTFRSCESLTNITIPEGVTKVKDMAFAYCSGLKNITFCGTAPNISTTAFEGVVAVAFYPDGIAAWGPVIRQATGGDITWTAYTPGEDDDAGDSGESGEEVLPYEDAFSIAVTGTYVPGAQLRIVYSVDIVWTEMHFTYQGAGAQVWDPETHSYTGVNRPAGWQTSDAKITVTNHSNASIHVLPSYTADAAHTDAWVEFDTVVALVPSAAVSNRAEVATIGVAPRGSFTQPQSASIGTVTVTVRRAMDDTTAPELRTRISELQQAYHVVQDPAGLPEGVPYILQSDLDAALSNAATLDDAIDRWDGTAEQLDVLYTQYYLAQLQAINELVRTYHA